MEQLSVLEAACLLSSHIYPAYQTFPTKLGAVLDPVHSFAFWHENTL